jgi:hypothetical protein
LIGSAYQPAGVATLEAAINAIKASISSEGGILSVKMKVRLSVAWIQQPLSSFFLLDFGEHQ